jgi:hypothetical protein
MDEQHLNGHRLWAYFSVILFPICRLLIKENECLTVDVVRRDLFACHTEIIQKFCSSLQTRAKVFL